MRLGGVIERSARRMRRKKVPGTDVRCRPRRFRRSPLAPASGLRPESAGLNLAGREELQQVHHMLARDLPDPEAEVRLTFAKPLEPSEVVQGNGGREALATAALGAVRRAVENFVRDERVFQLVVLWADLAVTADKPDTMASDVRDGLRGKDAEAADWVTASGPCL